MMFVDFWEGPLRGTASWQKNSVLSCREDEKNMKKPPQPKWTGSGIVEAPVEQVWEALLDVQSPVGVWQGKLPGTAIWNRIN
jgi:hypothetical protein